MADGTPGGHAHDDLALVRRVLGGSARDLPRLAERLRCVPRILRLLDQRAGACLGPQDLGDLGQDVLVVLWRKLGEYEGLSGLEGWAHGFCVLEYRNAVRRLGRLRHEARVAVRRSVAEGTSAEDPDPWAFEEVHDGLRRIGREEARVIRLKHFEGRTFEEIGVVLGLSANTVKARYYRGLAELRPLLEAQGGEG